MCYVHVSLLLPEESLINPFLLPEMMTQMHFGKLKPIQGIKVQQPGVPGFSNRF